MTDLYSKKYKFASIENAIKLLRPNCKFVLVNNEITKWDHDKDIPTDIEIDNMIKMIKDWEDKNPESISKVWI